MNRISKRHRRRYAIRTQTSMEELQRLLDAQPPAKRHVLFAGEPTFIRSGIVSHVELVPSGLLIEDATIPRWDTVLRDGYRLRFAGHTDADLRIAWAHLPTASPRLHIHFCGSSPLQVGERFYVEDLPRVSGSGAVQFNTERFARVTFQNVAFQNGPLASEDD